jgi:hypothetical protein
MLVGEAMNLPMAGSTKGNQIFGSIIASALRERIWCT